MPFYSGLRSVFHFPPSRSRWAIAGPDLKHRGISPRALAHVFQEVNARIETAFSVTITYMEIYNEKIFDLLVDPAVNATKVKEGLILHTMHTARCALLRILLCAELSDEIRTRIANLPCLALQTCLPSIPGAIRAVIPNSPPNNSAPHDCARWKCSCTVYTLPQWPMTPFTLLRSIPPSRSFLQRTPPPPPPPGALSGRTACHAIPTALPFL